MNITSLTKVAEVLDAYPELEKKLIKLSPAFKKLSNPILRNTVAKVTTLAQAAEMIGIKPEDLIMQLKELLTNKD